jgi:hypothetical protein
MDCCSAELLELMVSEGGVVEIVELAEEGGCLGSTPRLAHKGAPNRHAPPDDDAACGSVKRQPVKDGEAYEDLLGLWRCRRDDARLTLFEALASLA